MFPLLPFVSLAIASTILTSPRRIPAGKLSIDQNTFRLRPFRDQLLNRTILPMDHFVVGRRSLCTVFLRVTRTAIGQDIQAYTC
jgi:hypothetical protein